MGIQQAQVGDKLQNDSNTSLNITTGGITICCWFKVGVLDTGNNHDLYNRRTTSGGFRFQYRFGGGLRYQFRFGAGNENHTTGDDVLTVNTLHFLTAVHAIGTGVKIFVDAVSVLDVVNTNTPIDSLASQTIDINGQGGGTSVVTKSMADMRLYDRALSGVEVKILFESQGSELLYTPRMKLSLTDYPFNHIFTGSEIFKDDYGLDFDISNGNPISFPMALKLNPRRRQHDVTYN